LERIYHYYRKENDPELNYLLAKYYGLNGQYDAAMPHLKFLMGMDDTDSLSFIYKPKALPLYARALHHAGEYALAEKYLTKVLQSTSETDPEYKALDLAILQCLNGPIVSQQPDTNALVEPISGFINSSYDDYRPVYDPASQTLYFTSARGVLKDKHIIRPDLFAVQVGHDYVTAPKRVRKLPNAQYKQTLQAGMLPGSIVYSVDDQPSLHTITSHVASDYANQWLRMLDQQGSKPVPMPGVIMGKYKDKDTHLSADGRYLFFCSLRGPKQGGYDIWMSEKTEKGAWATPVNLGANINSAQDEAAPFFDVPTQTLYYSSQGLDAMGGYDVFSVQYKGNHQWGEPRNMGLPINSPGHDLYYFPIGTDSAFVASSRAGTAGGLDIFFVRTNITDIERMAAELDGRYEEVEAMGLMNTDSLMMALNTEGDALLKEDLEDDPSHLIDSSEVSSPEGDDEDVISATKELGLDDEEDTEDELNIDKELETTMSATLATFPEFFIERAMEKAKTYPEVVRLRKGDRLVLDHLEFIPGTTRFTKEAAQDLDKLFWLLISNPGMQVLITGHTDNQGEAAYLRKLSEERAMKVVLFLVLNKGIEESRLKYAGKGSEVPVDSNDTPEGRTRNNRIEVDIILK
ncbi:MAG: OmpA family protein, partial [Bacteroidetes bacterium]|nr:OmpA family protein [Bacteroidota bacterium]